MLSSFDLKQTLHKLLRKLAGIEKSRGGKKKEINSLMNSALIFFFVERNEKVIMFCGWQSQLKYRREKTNGLSTDCFQYFTSCF